jgi:hypothetical protein
MQYNEENLLRYIKSLPSEANQRQTQRFPCFLVESDVFTYIKVHGVINLNPDEILYQALCHEQVDVDLTSSNLKQMIQYVLSLPDSTREKLHPVEFPYNNMIEIEIDDVHR